MKRNIVKTINKFKAIAEIKSIRENLPQISRNIIETKKIARRECETTSNRSKRRQQLTVLNVTGKWFKIIKEANIQDISLANS